MAKYVIDGSTLTSIADAIREKAGASGVIVPEQMAAVIAGIVSGGGAEMLYGTYTTEAYQGKTVTLGVTFPDKENHIIVILPHYSTDTGNYKVIMACAIYSGGTFTAGYSIETGSKSTSRNVKEGQRITITDPANGAVTFAGYELSGSKEYFWIYAGWD